MKRYRRKGIGKVMAFHIFDKFRGTWEIQQIPNNKDAISFWRNVVREYTFRNFEEIQCKGWNCLIFKFNSLNQLTEGSRSADIKLMNLR